MCAGLAEGATAAVPAVTPPTSTSPLPVSQQRPLPSLGSELLGLLDVFEAAVLHALLRRTAAAAPEQLEAAMAADGLGQESVERIRDLVSSWRHRHDVSPSPGAAAGQTGAAPAAGTAAAGGAGRERRRARGAARQAAQRTHAPHH